MTINQNQSIGYLLTSRDHKVTAGLLSDKVVDLVDDILFNAIVRGASDVHWEPSAHGLLVRFRIDGVLCDGPPEALEEKSHIFARLKILSGLDIAEQRLPQDGKLLIRFVHDGAERLIDVRFATFPCLHGEKVVTRILDRATNLLNTAALALPADVAISLQRLQRCPSGFLLVCGPTGSGKTTTLYALLNGLEHKTKNIVTMEDPIEYELIGVNQSQVNVKTGFTFENGLRSLLRQDPDVIMIGEIRDKTTAQIALEAALTGHLVMSTIHTSFGLEAIIRLMEMGIEPYLISAALTGVLAQRLVRKLCTACKKAAQPTPHELSLLALHGFTGQQKLYTPRGCDQCFGIGYQGRVGIFELLLLSDELRELLHGAASVARMRELLALQGARSLLHDGLSKAINGITSFEEVMAVVA